ncbi:MmcQ/YjbR family DNA-binding protein [Diaminobutyricibacter sp. McL0608]|uniref:MmcQ/YjbR family DNA-binding protein n=1 Tax=Leifsonia sp. McL0608 TaxID=3143537 RepID=UPI0031F306D4
MATLDDLRRTAVGLPGSEERATTGGAAWFVRGKLYAWECHPWPSIPADIREIVATELVVGVKVADSLDALALVEMAPNVFLRTTTPWGEPKVAFRMAGIEEDHLAELVTEAWRVQAPKYLRREFDDVGASRIGLWPARDRPTFGDDGSFGRTSPRGSDVGQITDVGRSRCSNLLRR